MNKLFFILFLFTIIKAEAQPSALNFSDSLYAVGNYSEAIQDLENIEEKSEAVYSRLAKSYVAKGDLSSALKNCRTVLDKKPNKVLTAMAYGEVLIKAEKLKSADSLYINLSTRYPKNASFQFQLGTIKERQNDSTAIEYWQKTIALDKTHQQALYKLAKDALSKRNFPLAEELSLQGLETNPSNASLLSILAQTYFNENSFVLAIQPFEKLLELRQGNEFVHSKLGFCYYHQQSNIDEAITQYELA